MHDTKAFFPLYTRSNSTPAVSGSLQPSVTVAATDAAAESSRFPGTDNNNFTQIQIANKSIEWAHVNFGISGAVVPATVATGYPVAPGAVVVVSVDPEVTAASVILDTAAATGDVIFTRGEGL